MPISKKLAKWDFSNFQSPEEGAFAEETLKHVLILSQAMLSWNFDKNMSVLFAVNYSLFSQRIRAAGNPYKNYDKTVKILKNVKVIIF